MQIITFVLSSVVMLVISNCFDIAGNRESYFASDKLYAPEWAGIGTGNSNVKDNRAEDVQAPSKNLFGQPNTVARCLVKEAVWVGTKTKSTFVYNEAKQLVRHSETDGGMVVTIEYNSNGQISRVLGFDPARVMRFNYDEKGVLKTLEAVRDGGTETVTFTYSGDKIVKANYREGVITYYFDENYDLVKAVTEDKSSKGLTQETIVADTRYKNYLLGTGDYRFLPLLYGDYGSAGAYTNALVNQFKKSTSIDKTVQPATEDLFETEVESSNSNDYPTSIAFRFKDAGENFKIQISYECN